MPQIPSFPSVQQQGIPGARLDPSVSSAAFAGNVNKTPDLSPAIAFAEKARNDADQVAVSAADAQLVQAKTKRLWDPQTGAMNARGKDAIPASDQANADFQKDADEIENTLTDGRQKEAFRRRVDMHYADLGSQLGQHVAGQIKQYDTDTTNGHVDAFQQDAFASFQDPNTVEQAVAGTRGTLTDYWRRNGHGEGAGVDDFAQHHIQERVSAIRAGVIARLLDPGTPQASTQARAYLTAHADDMTIPQRLAAEKLVSAGESEAETTKIADKIIGLNQATPQQPKTYADAVAEAEKITDGGQRKEVLGMIDAHYSRQERAEQRVREDALERLSKRMEQTGGQINKASPDYQVLLGHPELQHLLAGQERIIRPPKDPGDPDLYLQQLNTAGIEGTRRAFLNTDILKLPGLNTQQRTALLNLQRQLNGTASRQDDAAQRHEVQRIESEQRHYQYQHDKAVAAGDEEGAATARQNLNRLDHHLQMVTKPDGTPTTEKASVTSPSSGTVDLSTAPKGNTLSVDQLDRIAADRLTGQTKYEEYLKIHGYTIPAVIHHSKAAPK